MTKRLKVFISYTWDDDSHKDWVRKLTDDLITQGGLDVQLDQYELVAGKDMNHFMERGVEEADKVLIILTEKYKEKADQKQGGTGFEYSMISNGLYQLQASNNKFIPILRKGDLKTSAPTYVQTKVYLPMIKDENYEFDLFELIRLIYSKPRLKKPKLGAIPDFDNVADELDPVIKIAKELKQKELLNSELDYILKSTKGVDLAKREVNNLLSEIEIKVNNYNNLSETTGLVFKFESNYRNETIVNCLNYSVSISYHNQITNTAEDATLIVKFWKGHLVLNRYDTFYFPGDEPKTIKQNNYKVDLNEFKNIVWKNENNYYIQSSEIIKEIFSFFIKSIQETKEKKFRK